MDFPLRSAVERWIWPGSDRNFEFNSEKLDPFVDFGAGISLDFYIPFYAGFAVGKYLFKNNSSAKDRDLHCELLVNWDEDWGSSCIYMPGMRNITRHLIEKNPWDYFDIGVPYPTGLHPSTADDIAQGQNFVRHRERKTLFCFAGATRGRSRSFEVVLVVVDLFGVKFGGFGSGFWSEFAGKKEIVWSSASWWGSGGLDRLVMGFMVVWLPEKQKKGRVFGVAVPTIGLGSGGEGKWSGF
ncbi:hypothetical protein H5410_016587 [Solanum commersonii]|uniref:Uncharacterized protein n=1 Tax=Solanum commersonii TaxID=4109 RepID=A0A9J5ZXE9_SOLCO|nr:hypothetical protein H5410_016587 [Solanum commersonii]